MNRLVLLLFAYVGCRNIYDVISKIDYSINLEIFFFFSLDAIFVYLTYYVVMLSKKDRYYIASLAIPSIIRLVLLITCIGKDEATYLGRMNDWRLDLLGIIILTICLFWTGSLRFRESQK